MKLYEKYRPKTFNDVLGQEKAVKRLNIALKCEGFTGAFWIEGKSGTGKTTLARILADENCEACDIFEFKKIGQDFIDTVDKVIRERKSIEQWGKDVELPNTCFIINEAQGLKLEIMRQLLMHMESSGKGIVFVFTTTERKFETIKDASALLSRCNKITLTNQKLKETFAERLAEIAVLEELTEMGNDLKKRTEKLVEKCNNNMRLCWNEVASGALL